MTAVMAKMSAGPLKLDKSSQPGQDKIKSQKEQAKPALPQGSNLIVRSRFVRMAPDKVRLVAKTILGQEIDGALSILSFTSRLARKPLILLLKNARAQANDKNMDNPTIKNILVDGGPKLKRRRIIHRGRATTILKRMSHITVVLSEGSKAKKMSSPIKSKKQPEGVSRGS